MHDHRTYPFAALVGQESMKLALVLNVVNPTISGVLIRGEKGTAKSTAVRALADILPEVETVRDCPFNLPAEGEHECCAHCANTECRDTPAGDRPLNRRKVRVVELPVGATEDRVAGTLDIEHALKAGEKRIEPGILAAAHQGILYVDEVNLLDDHIVDILLDSAAMGKNTVEREGVSFSHPARFVLVGTMNPEEGELRPQLLDRFGLCTQVRGIADPEMRVTVMERRAAFDEDPDGFWRAWEAESMALGERIGTAMERYAKVSVSRDILLEIANLCIATGVDGHRADIVCLKAAKTLCAWEGRGEVTVEDVNRAAEMALPHRLRRQPFEDVGESSMALAGGARQ
ncbi:MAG: ATP-binding protein [Desulfatibacillaceae bacterium]